MIQTTLNFLMSGQKDIVELGLRSSNAIAQLSCDCAERLGKLQVGALRSAAKTCGQAAVQMLSNHPTGEMAPNIEAMQQTMNYWRSLAGLVAVTQAELADLLQSSSHEVSAWTESHIGKSNQTSSDGLPLAIYAAAGASILNATQAMCSQLGETARQFAANAGLDSELAFSQEANEAPARARAHRKAA